MDDRISHRRGEGCSRASRDAVIPAIVESLPKTSWEYVSELVVVLKTPDGQILEGDDAMAGVPLVQVHYRDEGRIIWVRPGEVFPA